ncbi:MAG: Asp-tRNA(Asn)/Glu-tRNA(Gln) amidotransferase subunit GatA [Gammaproteobacteria bacterium]|nr:Asp-tRNA(Asn)/Glu-tRNA(Gln) amidotransferase subunit GatA [Gammaproteobacteria bacterium]
MNGDESIAALRRGLLDRRYSAVELTERSLSRIDTANETLNCFITIDPDGALAAAAAADSRIARGEAGPLTGIPLAHKDVFCTRGIRTTCASRMLANFIAPYDATAVSRLAHAGAVCLGKTNMDEFAMGSSNETSWFGPARNPWDPGRAPGGSSGGSAAAVCAGLVPCATGTDTGGSIRQPAAFCGVTGLKPTYGRVSRYGMVAFASSLDQGGAFARDAEDVAALLQVMEGHDPLDSTSTTAEPTAFDGSGSMTIGLPGEYWDDLDADMGAVLDDATRELEAAGHTLKTVSLPHTTAAVPAYYVIASAEASANLSRYDGVRFGYRAESPDSIDDLYRRSRAEGFGAEVKRRILTGTYALSIGYYDAYYLQAQRVRRLIRQDFLDAFDDVDVIAAPVTPGVAFPLGAVTDPVAMYRQDVFTIPASLAGLPAMSLPCGLLDGLPAGLQLIGPHFEEGRVLELGAEYQRRTDWHRQRPHIIPLDTGGPGEVSNAV